MEGFPFGGATCLGITTNGPPPLGRVFLPLQRGVSVYYGLNGAGKTALLRAVATLFRGRGTDPEGHVGLHLELPPVREIEWPSTSLLRSVFDAISEEFRQRWQEREGGEPPIDPERRTNLEKLVAALLRLQLSVDGEEWLGAIDEVAPQRLVTLIPAGSKEARWGLWVAARCDDSTPTLRRGLALREASTKLSKLNVAIMDEDQSRAKVLWEELQRIPEIEQALPTSPPSTMEEWWQIAPQIRVPSFLHEVPREMSGPELLRKSVRTVIPLFNAGFISGAQALPQLVSELGLDLPQETLELVRFDEAGRPRHVLQELKGQDPVLPEKLAELLPELSNTATHLAKMLLLDAPELRLKVLHPDQWLHEAPVVWEALDSPSQEWVPINSLSQAQRRWSEVAARVAIHLNRPPHEVGLVTVDEPEAALHALAERYLVGGLSRLAERLGVPVIVATHSAELLNNPQLHLHHVYRDQTGHAQVDVMESPLREELGASRLGLSAADILQLYRVFLFVEGSHDEAVVRGLIGDVLEEARTCVIPIRGTERLVPLVDSRILFDFTDAVVVVAVDRVHWRPAVRAWENAKALLAKDRPEEAMSALKPIRRIGTHEAGILYAFSRRAIESRKADRIVLAPLEKPDVIYYLDVQRFVPDAKSWDELIEEWNRSGDFKRWLQDQKGAVVTEARLQEIVREMDEVPEEIALLGDLCLRLSGDKRAGTGLNHAQLAGAVPESLL